MIKGKSVGLNKYIAQSGICSRRKADEYIKDGRVKINKRKAKIADRVKAGDIVMVNGQTIEPEEAQPFVFIALNKPVGIVSTTEPTERNNIVSYTNYPFRIFPIGRLDKDSTGLIFLTNDGDIVNKVLRAGNNHEKEYIVTVDKPITDEFITDMSRGVPVLGVITKKCKVEKISTKKFRIILVQGLNRQIRRMSEYFGYEVTDLQRIRIMHVNIDGLPEGDFRPLTEDELKTLFSLVKDSSSEDNPKKSTAKKNTDKKSTTKKNISKKSSNKKKTNTKVESFEDYEFSRNNNKRSNRPSSKKVSKKPGRKKRRR